MSDEVPEQGSAYRDVIESLIAKAWATGETQHMPFLGLTVVPDVIAVEQSINGDPWEPGGRWVFTGENGRTAYIYTDPLEMR